MDKWDKRFLELAQFVAQWSKDPSTKVGAVIVRPNRTICSVGYNGYPRGMDDSDYSRPVKYDKIIHAEINAILNASECLNGFTLYTWPMLPCCRCAVQVIQAGIRRVVSNECTNERWAESIEKSETYFKEAGVQYGIRL